MKLSGKLRLRRQLIVDREFQYSLIRKAVAFVLITFALTCGALFLPLIRAVDRADGSPARAYETVTAFLYMHEHFWPVALLCLLVAIAGVVRVSHQIAGPLVRFKRDLRSVGEGRFPRPLHTRDRDYLKAEVDVLNQMVERLATRVEEIQGVHRELCSALRERRFEAACAEADRLSELLQVFHREGAAVERREPLTEARQPAQLC